ncbi:MAG: DUF4911 domain-containing protein [Candidatus Sumerlaeia bacterium]
MSTQADSSQNPRGRWSQLPRCHSRCNRYIVRVQPEKIGFINAVFEGYDWIARIRTESTHEGIMEISVPAEWDDVFQGACSRLSQQTPMHFMRWERHSVKARD